ncbi:MAG: substrate-binding domain-containing protein [Chloroflexota bacterium]
MNRKFAKLFAVGATVALAATSFGTAAVSAQDGYTIGFSNSGGVGNGWREEQLCSVRAQAAASGEVASLNDIHRDTDQAGQLEDIRNLTAAGVNAIVLNPSSPDGLNSAIKEATDQGIVVVAVDAAVTEPSAYNLSNDQAKYAQIGAEWLFEKLGGTGRVYYMRGIAGHPADTLRDEGWQAALANYPDIEVAVETSTGWDPAVAKQQMSDTILSGEQIDGVWTSGLGKSVVDAYIENGEDLVPIVGADNAGFVGYLTSIDGLEAAAVTNPGTVGGAGVTLALRILNGDVPESNTVFFDPVLWANDSDEGRALIEANQNPDLDPLWPVLTQIEGWTTYTDEALIDCVGPA